MKSTKKTRISFFTKLLLALMLVQFHLPNQIFCIESDGSTSIETVSLGSCVTTLQQKSTPLQTTTLSQNCNPLHQDSLSCEDCTDIPLKQEISKSRSDSEQASLKVLSPSYFDLYAGGFKPYISYPNTLSTPLLSQTPDFVYHPYQNLESIILII
jgi:hypothetical protein|tara:strand:+ start:134 stop:598 length:465 start_codon:yes stop_codon:yes gene_type:complete